jgi:hypothetical protein
MKRIALLAIVAVLVAAAGTGLVLTGRQPDDTTRPAAKADSVWYHASDVALLAKTGRPQLVEFFHPD